jgi:hypothetical protein
MPQYCYLKQNYNYSFEISKKKGRKKDSPQGELDQIVFGWYSLFKNKNIKANSQNSPNYSFGENIKKSTLIQDDTD